MEQALIKSCFQRNDFVCYHSEFETSIQIGEHGRNFNTKSQHVPNPIISSKDWLVRFVFISKCAVGIINSPPHLVSRFHLPVRHVACVAFPVALQLMGRSAKVRKPSRCFICDSARGLKSHYFHIVEGHKTQR